ncbi:MAG: hypothetical protein ACL93V_11545 [Candidatus Electrothrix sp. YB6]
MLTGYGRGDLEYIGPHQDIQPAKVAENLQEAVEWILRKRRGNCLVKSR